MQNSELQFVCAFAADDEKHFTASHFGDAEFYLLYVLNKDEAKYVGKIDNTSIETDAHADPEKAKSVSRIMKKKGVQVLVSRRFGPNIVRVKNHFVPVLVRQKEIEEGLKVVQDNLEVINEQWNKDSSQRKHLTFR